MLRCPKTKPCSHIPSFLQGEDGRPGPVGDRGPAVSTPFPQLHPDPGPFLTTPLFSPPGLAWEPWGAWRQGEGLCGLRSWGENDATSGIGVPKEVLPAPCNASLQLLTFLTGRPWGPRTQRRQGESLGRGAMGRQAAALAPSLTPTSLFGCTGRYCGGGGAAWSTGQQGGAGKNSPYHASPHPSCPSGKSWRSFFLLFPAERPSLAYRPLSFSHPTNPHVPAPMGVCPPHPDVSELLLIP